MYAKFRSVLHESWNGDYVASLEEFDTTCMDSVWLAIKISWKVNDDSGSVVDHSKAAMILRVTS